MDWEGWECTLSRDNEKLTNIDVKNIYNRWQENYWLKEYALHQITKKQNHHPSKKEEPVLYAVLGESSGRLNLREKW